MFFCRVPRDGVAASAEFPRLFARFALSVAGFDLRFLVAAAVTLSVAFPVEPVDFLARLPVDFFTGLRLRSPVVAFAGFLAWFADGRLDPVDTFFDADFFFAGLRAALLPLERPLTALDRLVDFAFLVAFCLAFFFAGILSLPYSYSLARPLGLRRSLAARVDQANPDICGVAMVVEG